MIAKPVLNKALLPLIGLAIYLLLSSCGFTPAYGERSDARAVFDRIALADPDNRDEYGFLKAVEARIPQAADPVFQVKYRVRVRDKGVPLRGVPRRQLHGDVRFDVVNLRSGKTVLSDEIESFTSYTDEGDLRLPQKRDAEDRLVQILADQFITRLTMRSAKLAASLE
ncbi:hypothetical protein N5A93_17455 [Roseovarius sp. EGI FJ00037]|uniref:hypothetical protein n=1 Tax=Roseovarius salincola TaxID=2978479 RepID=UPI0022A83EBB|nr:hypothetical protein [Roseovarius sp. EGI FJ00037]MCZ0814010.1 hypothetical protein [Roseovarius sp. EGI FJ00037]